MSKRLLIISAVLISAVLALAGTVHAAGLPVIKVGHVGHDHQIALYVAADEGQALEKHYGVYLKKQKDMEVYDLYDGGKPVAQMQLVLVGGGAKMPAALEQGHIEVGLGGLGPTAKFVDKGTKLKVLAPLNNDGDMLVVGNHIKANSWDEFVSEIKASGKPLRVGYKSPMAVAYMIFVSALKEEGISYGIDYVGPDGKPVKVITVNLQDAGNALPSLVSGVIDAVVINEPTASILAYKGEGRIISDLSSLPPKGKWEGHPCCVVAATSKALKEKRAIIVSLLKVIAAGADIIALDSKKALDAEVRWTRTNPEVGRSSIKNVDYVIAPDKEWLDGVNTWLSLMDEYGHFNKDLKGKDVKGAEQSILDLGPAQEAMKGLKLRSRQGK